LHQQRRIGFILIAVGALVPLLLLHVTTGYSRDANILTNILTARIIVWDQSKHQPGEPSTSSFTTNTGQRSKISIRPEGTQRGLEIPYRFPLAFCILLIFLGIRQIDQSRTRNSDTE
jgi:hypothetical protein